MKSILNIHALRQYPTRNISSGTSVIVAGHFESADGGGGIFVWTQDKNAIDDNGIVIVPNSPNRTGCWKRIFDGAVNVRWFGAKGDGANDDTLAFENMLTANLYNPGAYPNYGSPHGGVKTDCVRSFYIPTGTYKLTKTIGWKKRFSDTSDLYGLPFNIRIEGDYRQSSVLLFDLENDNTGILAIDSGANIGEFHISHLQIKTVSTSLKTKYGLYAHNGGYIFVCDCMFHGWDTGIWYNGTENVTIERTGFTGAAQSRAHFIGIQLGNPAMSPSSTAVIAIRDCTFLSAVVNHIGILAQSCNLLEVTGNYFSTFYSLVLGSCININVVGNGTEGSWGQVFFSGAVANANFVQNQFNCANHCIEVAEGGSVAQLSLINNVFGALECAITDLHDKIASVHVGSNLLNTRHDGTPPPMFNRKSPRSTFGALDIYHTANKDSLALALRCQNGNESFPYYAISGFNQQGEKNNFTGSTIIWVGNRGMHNVSELLAASGEIRYLQDFVITTREDSKWTDTIQHRIPEKAFFEFELKAIFTDSWMSTARHISINGLVVKGYETPTAQIVRMATLHDDYFDYDDNHSRQPAVNELLRIMADTHFLKIAVKGNRESQWLLALTVFQKIPRNVATAE